MFYTGTRFPEWKGNLFVGSLKEHALIRLILNGEHVVGEEHLLTDRNQRIRDVRQGAGRGDLPFDVGRSLLRLVPKG